jgi:small-conductance mechanosensitive channel
MDSAPTHRPARVAAHPPRCFSPICRGKDLWLCLYRPRLLYRPSNRWSQSDLVGGRCRRRRRWPGLGLQNIIHNFVSGSIILAERPIAIGDRIEISGVAGQVREIRLRSTTVVTNDNIACIVPNSDFITSTVTNWSHGDLRVRIRLPVGVACGTDPRKLEKLLLEVALARPKVLREPAPSVFFLGFGDSSLNFELGVWTSEMTFQPRRFRSELFFAMEEKLRENQIEIPFPQRDLHLRSGKFVLQNAPPATTSGDK